MCMFILKTFCFCLGIIEAFALVALLLKLGGLACELELEVAHAIALRLKVDAVAHVVVALGVLVGVRLAHPPLAARHRAHGEERQPRLVVRDVETLEIVHIFSCKDVIEKIEWSRDSKYVLCGIFKRGLAQIWSVEQPEWYCNVDEGPIGLACVRFSPGGRHVLATADFQLRITVWSLLDRSVCYIRFPKFTEAGLDSSDSD